MSNTIPFPYRRYLSPATAHLEPVIEWYGSALGDQDHASDVEDHDYYAGLVVAFMDTLDLALSVPAEHVQAYRDGGQPPEPEPQPPVEAINLAARELGATVWSPEQWGDRNADAYALTMPGIAGVVMVNTDTVTERDVDAYAYRAQSVPRRASDIMPALMADDGASLDPIAGTTGNVVAGDIGAALRSAIMDAFSHLSAPVPPVRSTILAVLDHSGEWVYVDDRITVVDMPYVRMERDPDTIRNYLRIFREYGDMERYVQELEQLLATTEEDGEGPDR